MGNIGSITGRKDECTHVTREIESNGKGWDWELRPDTELASIEFVDEWETNRKSPVVTRAPKPSSFYIDIPQTLHLATKITTKVPTKMQ